MEASITALVITTTIWKRNGARRQPRTGRALNLLPRVNQSCPPPAVPGRLRRPGGREGHANFPSRKRVNSKAWSRKSRRWTRRSLASKVCLRRRIFTARTRRKPDNSPPISPARRKSLRSFTRVGRSWRRYGQRWSAHEQERDLQVAATCDEDGLRLLVIARLERRKRRAPGAALGVREPIGNVGPRSEHHQMLLMGQA